MTDDRRRLVVRPAIGGDLPRCTAIASGLPRFFPGDVPAQIGRDLTAHGGWVVSHGEQVHGFTVVRRGAFPQVAEIIWAAVDARDRGRGLGKNLVSEMLVALEQSGISLVEVKTLDPSAGFEPYLATHAFWLACGFVQIDVIDPLPGWEPGNPAAILVAALGTTVRQR